MADEFDPLKQTTEKPAEPFYSIVQKNTKHDDDDDDDDLLRPQHESVLRRERIETNTPNERPTSAEIYQKLDFTNNAAKAPVRSTNPFNEEVQKLSPPSSHVIQQLPQKPPPPPIAKASEQQAAACWDTTDSRYHQDYETGSSPSYYSQEYYEDNSSYKRRSLTAAMDRIVQRFPTLGLFYKPSVSAEIYPPEYVEEVYDGDQAPELVDATTLSRELTADELALSERYSNKLRTQIINLQIKDQTQPVDVSIHHDSYTIYSCDVGRSVVEIFDMYGKLQHVIDDQTTIKFQPTAIAVGYDGTIIVGSHFHHRLHMYSSVDPPENDQNNSSGNAQQAYHFQQYKLGSPGHNVHEFHYPAGISIDYSDGYLYVCDRGNYRIQVLRPEGVCERMIELFLQDEELNHIAPIQVAVQQHSDQLVCIIGKGDAICFVPKYTNGEAYIEPLYILDNDGIGLQGASGIAVDADDQIFISDTGHHRIVICTPEGSYLGHFGVEGSGPGELKRPCGLDITNDGTVVVADSGNKRLQLFGSIREQSGEDKKPTLVMGKADSKNILLLDTERQGV